MFIDICCVTINVLSTNLIFPVLRSSPFQYAITKFFPSPPKPTNNWQKGQINDNKQESKIKYTYPVCVKKKNHIIGATGWLSQLSIWLWLRSWSRSLWVWAPHQALCWQLRAWSLPRILCLPLSLCPSPAFALFLPRTNK